MGDVRRFGNGSHDDKAQSVENAIFVQKAQVFFF